MAYVAADEYEGLMETVHLLKSPANEARLLRSIREADEGKLTDRELINQQRSVRRRDEDRLD